jgi:hypothetical protein
MSLNFNLLSIKNPLKSVKETFELDYPGRGGDGKLGFGD